MASYTRAKMITAGSTEAKNRFGELLMRVLEGHEVVITRHRHPIARLVAFFPKQEDEEKA